MHNKRNVNGAVDRLKIQETALNNLADTLKNMRWKRMKRSGTFRRYLKR